MIDTKLEQINLLVRSNEKILNFLFLRQRNLTACWQSMVTIAGSKKESGLLAYINENIKSCRIESSEDDALASDKSTQSEMPCSS